MIMKFYHTISTFSNLIYIVFNMELVNCYGRHSFVVCHFDDIIVFSLEKNAVWQIYDMLPITNG